MISIIIVTCNSEKYFNKCIDSIIKQFNSIDDYEILIIDNNSTKKPLIYNNINMKIIINKNNKGYSTAINQGVLLSSGSSIALINPDIILKDNCINNLYNCLNNNKSYGVIGARLLNKDMTYQLSSMRRFPKILISILYFLKIHKLGLTNYYNYQDLNPLDINNVDSISGACMLFNRETYNKVNGFNENYFLYFEDTDFCYSVKKINLKVVYNPKAEAIHYRGSSTKSLYYLYNKYIFIKSLLVFFIFHIKEYKLFLFNIFVTLIYIITLFY